MTDRDGAVLPFVGAIFSLCPCGFLLVLPVQFAKPKHATICVSQRHTCSCPRHGNLLLPALTGAFHTGLACYCYLSLLSITRISTMLMHVFGKRGGTSADRGARASLCFPR